MRRVECGEQYPYAYGKLNRGQKRVKKLYQYQADGCAVGPLFGATSVRVAIAVWRVNDVEKRNIPPQSLVPKPPFPVHVMVAGAVPRGYVRAVLVDD